MDESQVSASGGVPRRGDKRRAPYAARACDACRRRKGRCDGRKPCEHCLGRSLECVYSQQPSGEGGSGAGTTGQHSHYHHHLSGSGRNGLGGSSSSTGIAGIGGHDFDGDIDPVGSLSGLVISLQDQLNTLTAFMKDHQRQQASAAASAPQPPQQQQPPPADKRINQHSRVQSFSTPPTQDADTSPQSVNSSATDDSSQPVAAANSAIKRTSLPFYGPTSPEYSLNAAKITMSARQLHHHLQQGLQFHQQQQQVQHQAARARMPSLADEMTDEDSGNQADDRSGEEEEDDGGRGDGDDDEEGDQCSTLNEDGDRYSIPSVDKAARQPVYLLRGLLRFANELSRKETARLLGVYQEIIGSIHPICDIEALTKQLDRWYGCSSPSPGSNNSSSNNSDNKTGGGPRRGGLTTRAEVANETDQLLMLGLALATALSAESVSRSELARELYDGFKDTAMSKLITANVTTEKDVVIALMMGFYEYFNGRLQHAWRMCGLAGRMAMQLGMHSREISQRNRDRGSFAELATMTCSLVILDRQWSAAAGLPPNFQLTDFDSALPGAVQHPYLKAMMLFTLMSQSFNDPVTRVAAGETSVIDDDAVDLVMFQIEQWRRKTFEKQPFVHPRHWESLGPGAVASTPSWMTMLYLRANAVRAILLRPYFLSSPASSTATAAGASSSSPSSSTEQQQQQQQPPSSPGSSPTRKIRPALELITDSIDTLSILDQRTDTYRKQHPQFQHFLASVCALLFLVIAYAEDSRAAGEQQQQENIPSPTWYADKVRHNFRKALALSAAYRSSSSASRRLWKRLVAMRGQLIRQGILPHDEAGPERQRSDTRSRSSVGTDDTEMADCGGGGNSGSYTVAKAGEQQQQQPQSQSQQVQQQQQPYRNHTSRPSFSGSTSANDMRGSAGGGSRNIPRSNSSSGQQTTTFDFHRTVPGAPSYSNNSNNAAMNLSSASGVGGTAGTARPSQQNANSNNNSTMFRATIQPSALHKHNNTMAGQSSVAPSGNINSNTNMPAKGGHSAATTATAAAAAQALINLNPFVAPAALSSSYNGSGSGVSGGASAGGGGGTGTDASNGNEDLSYLDFARIGSSSNSNTGSGAGALTAGNFYRGGDSGTAPQQGQNPVGLDTQVSAYNSAGAMGDVATVSSAGEADFLGSGGLGGGGSGGGGSGGGGGGGAPGNQGPLTNEFFALDWPTCDGVYFFSEGRLFDI